MRNHIWVCTGNGGTSVDRKSTSLNSSHQITSYAVFSFNYTATTEIYTLSLHDALPIFGLLAARRVCTDTSGDERMRKTSTWLLEQGTQTPSPAPDLIPAETRTENSHWDWYSERGHFSTSEPTN